MKIEALRLVERRRIRQIILLLCALVIDMQVTTPLLPAGAQSEQDNSYTLNLVFAVDTSGSMYRSQIPGRFISDQGTHRLIREGAGSQFGPTDPENLRFDLLRVLLQWLADFAQKQPNPLTINASIITFNTESTVLLPWTEINGNISGSVQSLSFDTPAEPTGERGDSNFVALHESLITQLDIQPSGADHTVIMTITDSIHCDQQINPNCQYIPSLIQDLERRFTRLSGAARHALFITNTTPPAQYWAHVRYGEWDVRQPMVNALTDQPANFHEVESIYQLPSELMAVVLHELALTMGLITPDVVGDVPPGVLAQMGVFASPTGTFEVPAYQASMDLLTFLPSSNAALTLRLGEEILRGSSLISEEIASEFTLLRVDRPQPGQWLASAQGSNIIAVWISFEPAEARIRLSSASGDSRPVQHGEYFLIYEMLDTGGESFIQEGAVPQFDFVLTPAEGGTETAAMHQIHVTSMFPVNTASGSYFQSDPFVLMTAGEYQLTTSRVEPNVSGAWRFGTSGLDFGFLTPQERLNIDVSRVAWEAQFGTDDQQTRIQNRILTLPRSMPVEIRVWMKNGVTPIHLPDGVTGFVSFEPLQGSSDPCPRTDRIALDLSPDNMMLFTAIDFDTDGACRLAVEVNFDSDLQPFGANEQPRVIASGAALEHQLHITPTSRLSLVMLDANERVLVQSQQPDTFDYTMDDRDSEFFRWNPPVLPLIVEFRDELGTPADPLFASNQAPDRSHCETGEQVGMNLSEATPELTAEAASAQTQPLSLVPQVREGIPIPLVLSITSSTGTENEAERLGICFVKLARPGRYVALISGLSPDTYVINVSFDRQRPPLNSELFEYGTENMVVTASLRVNVNPAIYAHLGIPSLLLLIVGGVVTARLAGNRARSIHPLNGEYQIYRVERENNTVEQLWSRAVKPNRNQHEFNDFDDLPVKFGINLSSIILSTHKEAKISEESAAYVKISGDGLAVSPDEKLMLRDSVIYLGTDLQNNACYLTHTSPSQSVTADHLRNKTKAAAQS